MAFFNKIFAGTNGAANDFSNSSKISSAIKSAPMRKLVVALEDDDEKQSSQSNTMDSVKKEMNIDKEASRKAEEVREMLGKKTNDELLKLKNSAQQIRNRVHYIDKNDFAKRAVSSKDRVYDFDLRRDLAHFLANDEFLTEVDASVGGQKTVDDFRKFEMLIVDAISNEMLDYVVYGDRTYVIIEEIVRENEQPKKEEKQQKEEPVKAETVAGLSAKNVEIFRKSAIEFVKNLEKESESEVGNTITSEEINTLTKIFTRRFLREMIAEKEAFMLEKMSFVPEEREALVGFVCNSIFK